MYQKMSVHRKHIQMVVTRARTAALRAFYRLFLKFLLKPLRFLSKKLLDLHGQDKPQDEC